MRTAILAHTDTLNHLAEGRLNELIDRAKKSPEIRAITTKRINGILQITIIYDRLTYAIYDLVGPLQNPKEVFVEQSDIFNETEGVVKKGFPLIGFKTPRLQSDCNYTVK